MNETGIAAGLAAVISAIVGAATTWLTTRRRYSGKVATTDADALWEANKQLQRFREAAFLELLRQHQLHGLGCCTVLRSTRPHLEPGLRTQERIHDTTDDCLDVRARVGEKMVAAARDAIREVVLVALAHVLAIEVDAPAVIQAPELQHAHEMRVRALLGIHCGVAS